jgi:hypothetical protein
MQMLASGTLTSNVYFGSKYKTKGFVRDLKQMPAERLPATLLG